MKEGSRHERAAIVASAYIIGFVTAFIGYGINGMSNDGLEKTFTAALPSGSNTASVIEATTHTAPRVEEKADGLYYLVGKSERLLTIKDAELAKTNPRDGIYTELTMYELSPDGQYVYFCEEPIDTSESCAPYVYSVAADTVYPVTQDGERIAIVAKKHRLEWTEKGLEAIAGITIDTVR